jgi:hypothetical protein
VTRFFSKIEVKVVGGIVYAKMTDGEQAEYIATTREAAIAAAMEVLEQMTPGGASGDEAIPMMRKMAAIG